MEIPLPSSAVSGSRCIKQIYTAPDCHKRHAAYRDARHRDRAFAAVKRHTRRQQPDRLRNLASSISGKEVKNKRGEGGEKERRGRGGVRSRERATWKDRRSRTREPHPRRRGVTAETQESADGSRGGQEAAGTRG